MGQRCTILILKRPAQAVFTDNLFDSQTLRINLISAQGGDVGITPTSSQTPQYPSSQNIPDLRRIATGVAQRTLGHPLGIQASGGQKLTEENKLSQRSDGCIRIPFDLNAAPNRVHRDRSRQYYAPLGSSQKTLTLRVSRNGRYLRTDCLRYEELAEKSISSNCRFKVNSFADVLADSALRRKIRPARRSPPRAP